eukprot:1153162-Pelagomonas_calceolata.AAC.3
MRWPRQPSALVVSPIQRQCPTLCCKSSMGLSFDTWEEAGNAESPRARLPSISRAQKPSLSLMPVSDVCMPGLLGKLKAPRPTDSLHLFSHLPHLIAEWWHFDWKLHIRTQAASPTSSTILHNSSFRPRRPTVTAVLPPGGHIPSPSART